MIRTFGLAPFWSCFLLQDLLFLDCRNPASLIAFREHFLESSACSYKDGLISHLLVVFGIFDVSLGKTDCVGL